MNRPISHITHIDNLLGIVAEGRLWSDAQRIQRGFVSQNIGYSHIKERRLRRPVHVAANGTIGQYVPFNFCTRSVMLYVISRGHDDYNQGQTPIIHLISDTDTVRNSNSACFFTDIHADLDYAEQIEDFHRLGELDFKMIQVEKYWQDFKEKKQAEFLAFDSVKWQTISKIGVISQEVARKVDKILEGSSHKPQVIVEPNWYY